MSDPHTQYLEQRVAHLATQMEELRPCIAAAWAAVRDHRKLAGFDEYADHDDDLVPGLAPKKAYAAGLETRRIELATVLDDVMAELEGDEFGLESRDASVFADE